jgi:hypothetical protein
LPITPAAGVGVGLCEVASVGGAVAVSVLFDVSSNHELVERR